MAAREDMYTFPSRPLFDNIPPKHARKTLTKNFNRVPTFIEKVLSLNWYCFK